MSWEQRNADFCKAQTDAEIAYIEAERRVSELEAENKNLRELVKHLYECARHNTCAVCEYADDACDFDYDMRELGVEA